MDVPKLNSYAQSAAKDAGYETTGDRELIQHDLLDGRSG